MNEFENKKPEEQNEDSFLEEEQEAVMQEHMEAENKSEEKPEEEDCLMASNDVEEQTQADQDALKQEKKPSFVQRHKNPLVLSGCFLLALVGGFGGTLAANQISGGGKVVMYQDTNTAKTTNTATSQGALSVKQISEKAAESVVEIKTESVSTNSMFPQAVSSGAGSGVILTKDGYIVTNHHVIEGADKITVTTKDGTSYNAKLIGSDASFDLAIIKIEAASLTPAVMGSSSKLEVGDIAVAIGNPLGELGGTVTSGIISALDREITVDNQKMHLLQTNAAINPGNSGGGLFNDQGELIGIVNAKSSGSNIEGLGFAIPIDRAKDVIENLIENGYVKGRASLGVTLASQSGQYNGKAAIYIAKLESGKAAEKAGLKVGDQILKVDDEDVSEMADVKTAVNSHKAGETMSVTVLRDNETKTIKVTLGEADTSSESEATQSDPSQQENPFLR